MASIRKSSTLADYQNFIQNVYAVPDDRFFSLEDIITNQQRFTMRALKGIRKNDLEKLEYNLCIAFSWLMAVCNRLHINLDDAILKRFPNSCSYCYMPTCICKKEKYEKSKRKKASPVKNIKKIEDFQKMFERIYPASKRTPEDAGIHLAEEMGELNESINVYFGEHMQREFMDIEVEIADYISCLFGLANSFNFEISKKLSEMYHKNCHVCQKIPCICTYSYVTRFKS